MIKTELEKKLLWSTDYYCEFEGVSRENWYDKTFMKSGRMDLFRHAGQAAVELPTKLFALRPDFLE